MKCLVGQQGPSLQNSVCPTEHFKMLEEKGLQILCSTEASIKFFCDCTVTK